MNTEQNTNASGVLAYELSRGDKVTLAFFGIMDALLNCSLDSLNAIFSRELRGTVAAQPVEASRETAELQRLRKMRTVLDRGAAKVESTTTIVITQKIPLQERLKAKTRRQALYSWRPVINPRA
jgi:hypothetical protein